MQVYELTGLVSKAAYMKEIERISTRAVSSGNLVEKGVSITSKNTFYNDAIKAWNLAPVSIKQCKTLWSAKNEIKKFVKTLPI